MLTFLLTLLFGALLGFVGSNLVMIYKPLYGYAIRMYISQGIDRAVARKNALFRKCWYGEDPAPSPVSINVKVEPGAPKLEFDFNNLEKLIGPMMQQMFSSLNRPPPRVSHPPTCADNNDNVQTSEGQTPASAPPLEQRATLKRPTFNVVG